MPSRPRLLAALLLPACTPSAPPATPPSDVVAARDLGGATDLGQSPDVRPSKPDVPPANDVPSTQDAAAATDLPHMDAGAEADATTGMDLPPAIDGTSATDAGGPPPGTFGAPCTRATDCDAGFCGSFGRCTTGCTQRGDCPQPSNWRCSMTPGTPWRCECGPGPGGGIEIPCNTVDDNCNGTADEGSVICGGRCVDIAIDPDNCGRCGQRCPGGTPCRGGVCLSGSMGAPLLAGPGGPSGFGAQCIPSSDDGSYMVPGATAIDLQPAFPSGLRYGARTHTGFQLNNNGSISFGSTLPSHALGPFPSSTIPLIAPWFADVDTRSGGQPTLNNVCFALSAGRLIATWHEVGYFAQRTDLRNSFQLILTPATGGAATDFDVELRYNRCEWTAGDASGGRAGRCAGSNCASAQAGFDPANGGVALVLPGSGTERVLGLCYDSNVGTPGVWRFRVRDGVPSSAGTPIAPVMRDAGVPRD